MSKKNHKVDKMLIHSMKTINALSLDGAADPAHRLDRNRPQEDTNEKRAARFAKFLAERKRTMEAAQQKQNEASASSSSSDARSTSTSK